ncbi:hypothetical protein [Chondromyces apiculatus]|uniref:Glycosyl hydrolase family 32, N terminal domain protein n=1 Tax=Chondromyces apiculatus DSM 436 TaxID=1192034 RepID=A0A017T1S5_9BACT|nr:hypothetical protein [Chondromyces apiculatus]EYF02491.1 Glycosyl hydrolase family 32, N terminal domain protein [Chondromyces apiculatus DSM 436]
MKSPRIAVCSFVVALAGCATLPSTSPGDDALPNAAAGPFRAIAQEELGATRVAPFTINDDTSFTRDPSVVDADGDPGTAVASGYFSATRVPEGETADPAAPPNAVVHHQAEDGRSFGRRATVVLEPEAAWEGDSVGAPSALRVEGEVWLYYAAAGGIGLARSSDGLAFTREEGPVLVAAPGGWEQGVVPAAPGVVRLPEGSFRMFYEVALPSGMAIGEARSADGIQWERLGNAPALAPSPPAEEGEESPYDDAGVGAPAPALAISATGRPILRVYHAATSRAGRATIGLAARFLDGAGNDAPLSRAIAPVFGGSASVLASAPWVTTHAGLSLLFANQRVDEDPAYPAVAVGVAPADGALPPPAP